ncbi:MAG: hypothetical protein KDB27_32795, partial [Planctomycetales bacterium]|nr:hypothetical protein [Planctomycetales bacterium]
MQCLQFVRTLSFLLIVFLASCSEHCNPDLNAIDSGAEGEIATTDGQMPAVDGDALEVIGHVEATIAELEKVGAHVSQNEGRVTHVHFGSKSKINRDAVASLVAFPHLASLSICDANATDAHIEPVRNLTGLRELVLTGNQLTDEGLKFLSGLSRLETLDVSNSAWVDSKMQITDDGLRHVAGLANLKRLGFDRNGISDAGLVH